MATAPEVGTYVVGDLATDGHTHIFVMGEHVLDQVNPLENPSLVSGDFPRATTAETQTGAQYPHAHSIRASTLTGEMVCGTSENHTHSVFVKQKK